MEFCTTSKSMANMWDCGTISDRLVRIKKNDTFAAISQIFVIDDNYM